MQTRTRRRRKRRDGSRAGPVGGGGAWIGKIPFFTPSQVISRPRFIKVVLVAIVGQVGSYIEVHVFAVSFLNLRVLDDDILEYESVDERKKADFG
ncbi:hypothetical protein GALMADRAFT_241810 [Galerina marginata CBS 339.88]|uniref:Uncharacterized protein n=1 Tax=Galerina marginata (strain CBS 339.88) TaxID=685588 RepID=A0A067TQQ7_GALM3|nr:hypothetical protein GALMADRAFT_241810 [Galerina marginata CBS 339.88]